LHRLDPVPGIETGGRLCVYGPNVMSGYLRVEDPGRIQPPEDGWYDTGDIVSIDEDGYVRIQGRAKRFAKIGGEMVSLAAVESMAADIWPDYRHAVVSLPDQKKGELLVLVTDNSGATREAVNVYAREQGIAAINLPARIMVVKAIRVLGTGKTDYRALTVLVEEGS